MTIKCLTFDLDDTLWAIYPVIDRAEQKFLDWMKTELPRIAEAFTRQTLSSHRQAYFKRFPELHPDLTRLRKNWSKALMEEFDPVSDVGGAANCGFKTIWVNLKAQDWQEVRQTECQPDAIIESILALPSAVDWLREKSCRD